MTANVVDLIQLASPFDVPNGDYKGAWTSYRVIVTVFATTYELKVDVGVRGLAVPCIVKVRNGEITVTAKD